MEQKKKGRGWLTSLQRCQGSSKGIKKYVIVHGRIVKDTGYQDTTIITTGNKAESSCSTTEKRCMGEPCNFKQLTLQGFTTKSPQKRSRLSTAPVKESLRLATMPWEKGVPASVVTRGVRKKASSVVNAIHEDKENVLESAKPSDDPVPDWRSDSNGHFHSRVSLKSLSNIGDSCPRVSRGANAVTFCNGKRCKNNVVMCHDTRSEGHKRPRMETVACSKITPGPSTVVLSNTKGKNSVDPHDNPRSGGCRTETSVLRETSPNVVLHGTTKDSNQCSDCQERPFETGFRTDENSETLAGQKPESEDYADTDELLAELSYCEKIRL